MTPTLPHPVAPSGLQITRQPGITQAVSGLMEIVWGRVRALSTGVCSHPGALPCFLAALSLSVTDYHSIYIGVPVPRGYRRKRRRRKSTSSRDKSCENERHYEQQDESDTDEGGQLCYDNGMDNASRTSKSQCQISV